MFSQTRFNQKGKIPNLRKTGFWAYLGIRKGNLRLTYTLLGFRVIVYDSWVDDVDVEDDDPKFFFILLVIQGPQTVSLLTLFPRLLVPSFVALVPS